MSNSLNPFAPPTPVEDSMSSPLARDFQRLAGTETGLRIVYYGIVTILLSVIFSAIGAAVFPPLVMVFALLIVIGWLMLIGGPFFCLSAPAETGASGLIVGSIVCQGLGILPSIAPFIGVQMPWFISGASALFGLIGSVLFILFLMRIATYIGREDLAQRGKNILIGSVILVLCAFGFGAAAAVVGPVAAFLMIAVAIGGLVLFVMYANLINALYKGIGALRSPAIG